MTEIISREELENLLAAMQAGDPARHDTGEGPRSERPRRVKPYDFLHPDRFAREQLKTLEMIHENFARTASAALSARLRSIVSMRVVDVTQVSFEEFVRLVPNPTTLGIINMEPLRGSAVLELAPEMSFAIIDRLFGGRGEPVKLHREISDIEMNALETVIVRMLGDLRESWVQLVDLRPRIARIETNPYFTQIVPPRDMAVLIVFDTKIGDIETFVNLCIPYITIEPIMNKLAPHEFYRQGESSGGHETALKERLDEMPVSVRCEVGEVELPLNTVAGLEVGDVVKIASTHVHDDMTFMIGERAKFKCRPGKIRGRLCVQIGEMIEGVPDEFLKFAGDED